MYVCEDVGVGFVGLSFGDGEIVDDDIGEFYLAHGVECHCRARFNIIRNSSEYKHFYILARKCNTFPDSTHNYRIYTIIILLLK